MPNSQTAAYQYIVHGQVQGVGFRYFVERCARKLRLSGHVENRADGTVKVYAVGLRNELTLFRQLLNKGSRYTVVDKVEELKAEIRDFDAFRIKF